MLALRILVLAGLGLFVLAMLGYVVSHDKRWLSGAWLIAKGAIALLTLMLLIYFAERLILIV